ncbi:MAG: calcineurin-like phosphoesterase C-terminal domain-containing protein [Alistipes sp.]|nr:calcineurin-like phosphoesterase C-terminal domain-containing protein [Alistipes sp.]
MKRFLLLASVVATLCFGCQKDNTSDTLGEVIISNGTTTIRVAMPQTRTYIGDKEGTTYPVYWSEGDELIVNDTASSGITINSANPSSAEFKFNTVLDYPLYILHSDRQFFGYNSYLAYIASEQSEDASNVPVYGIVKEAGEAIKLHHLTGSLRFSVKASEENVTLESITIRSQSDSYLSGHFIVNPIAKEILGEDDTIIEQLSSGLLTAYDSIQDFNLNSNNIVYTCDTSKPLSTSEARTHFITIPDNAKGVFTIELKTTDGKKMYCVWEAKSVNAGIVKEFSTLTFRENSDTQPILLKEFGSEEGILEVPNIFGYVKDTDGKPIAGVAVSDGLSVIATDENGYYEMEPSSDASHIFISIPAEYEVPINEYGQAGFYQRYPAKQQYDFTLKPLAGGKEAKFALFAIADPQVWDKTGFSRLQYEAIPGVAAHVAEVSQTMPCYGITLGDIISSNPTQSGNASEWRVPLREQFAKGVIGMPMFHTMGNHDNTYAYHGGGIDPQPDAYNSTWQIKMQRDHEAVFGPANYSFNRGDIHIVGMRNVEYYISTSNEYSSRIGFSAEQIEWLRQDLALVPKDKMVVLCAHIPFVNKDVESANAIKELLAPFERAQILTGHSHINRNYVHDLTSANGENLYEHVVGALCGSWWDSNIAMDGVPVGYEVFIGEGNNFTNGYYMSYADGMNSRSQQMRLYRGNEVTGGEKADTDKYGVKGYYKFNYDADVILANIYNADSEWKVEVYENGEYSGDMTLIPNKVRPYHDNTAGTTVENMGGDGSLASPYYSITADISSDMYFAGLHLGILGLKDNSYNTYGHCYHMYKYTLKNPEAEVMVKATDRFGNVYTETKFTTGTDYSITGIGN